MSKIKSDTIMGLSQLKYRTVAVVRDDKLGTNCHYLWDNCQWTSCCCVLVCFSCPLKGLTHVSETLHSFCSSLNSLLQSALFGIFLSHSPLWKISKWVSETCQASTLQASSQCWIGILNISSEHVLELAFKSPCLWALVWSLQILSHPNLILAV
jgi:hypothetical protein